MKQIFDYSLFDKMKDVEGYLEDEVSKLVFRYRVLANLTGNLAYIHKMLKDTKTFDFSKAEESFHEIDANYGLYSQMDVLAWLNSKKEQKNILLFGAGNMAEKYAGLLSAANISITAFIDNSCPQSVKCGIPVLSVSGNENRIREAYVVITSVKYCDEMYQQLKRTGMDMQNVYCPDQNSLISYAENVYFDSEVWSPCSGEIFVDAGCYNLYTASQFKKWCPDYRGVYAFEPDEENYRLCKENQRKYDLENVEIIKAGLWSSCSELNFSHQGDLGAGSCLAEAGDDSVHVVSLDDVLQGRECTFIKMDIEGAELQALEGAAETIRKWKPRLAICVYHKPKDIIEIPLYVKELVPEYKLKIRHYSTWFYDTVMYAYI